MHATAFLATCRELGELNFSPTVGRECDRAVVEMSARYAVPFGADSPVVRWSSPTTRNARGQWHELVQHLRDLAYLSQSSFAGWHAVRRDSRPPGPELRAAVMRAVEKFVAEDDRKPYVLLPDFPRVDPVARARWTERHLTVLIERLARYTSFDGDLEPRLAYRVGESSAFGRSLAFRMRVYFQRYGGRGGAGTKLYFDRDLLPYLHGLSNTLGGALGELLPGVEATGMHPDWQRLLCSSDEVFAHYRRAHRFTPASRRPYFLVYSADPPSDEAGRGDRRRRRRATRNLRKEELHEETGENHLGVRLLQIGLWRAGFYTGAVDGAFGKQSHAALLALIEQEGEEGAGTRVLSATQLRRVAVAAEVPGRGNWVVDLRLVGKLLDAYAPPPEEVARREEDEIWEGIRQSGQEERLDREFVAREKELLRLYDRGTAEPGRRVYYGVRGLLRGAVRAVGRVLRWIAGVVTHLVGAVFTFVKVVARRIQSGIGLFFTGFGYLLHYLVGRPFVTLGQRRPNGEAPIMATRYGADFDTVSFIDAGVSGEEVGLHRSRLRDMQGGIAFFMDCVVGMIGLLARMTPPTGWLRLAVALARYVYDWLRRPPAPREEVLV